MHFVNFAKIRVVKLQANTGLVQCWIFRVTSSLDIHSIEK